MTAVVKYSTLAWGGGRRVGRGGPRYAIFGFLDFWVEKGKRKKGGERGWWWEEMREWTGDVEATLAEIGGGLTRGWWWWWFTL